MTREGGGLGVSHGKAGWAAHISGGGGDSGSLLLKRPWLLKEMLIDGTQGLLGLGGKRRRDLNPCQVSLFALELQRPWPLLGSVGVWRACFSVLASLPGPLLPTQGLLGSCLSWSSVRKAGWGSERFPINNQERQPVEREPLLQQGELLQIKLTPSTQQC